MFLVEPRSHREVAAALAHPLPEEGAVEGTTGAGVHENMNSAAGNVPRRFTFQRDSKRCNYIKTTCPYMQSKAAFLVNFAAETRILGK